MEFEAEAISTPKLPLLSMAPMQMQSPEHSGMLTPPMCTSASVPFRWEEEPGKPKTCTSVVPLPAATTSSDQPKCLELPPRLLLPPDPSKTTKTHSPTTVLEGPFAAGANTRPKFSPSSFRLFEERHGSFDRSSSRSPDGGQLSTVVLGKKQHKGRGLLGSSRQSTTTKLILAGNKEVSESSFLQYPSSTSKDAAGFWSDEGSIKRVKITGIRRNGSFSCLSQARSHFWAAVYQGFKQVVPWKSRKQERQGLV